MLVATGKEDVCDFLGFNFKYILKQRSYDTNHLIIVFSGFGSNSDFTYDFLNSLSSSSRAAVLWIKDDFYHNAYATYYLDIVGESRLEQAVIGFIAEVQKFLQIKHENCTLLGCSKGGAAAIYYGMTYHFKNIFVSAPTLLIGSSIAGLAPQAKARDSLPFICNGVDQNEAIAQLDARLIHAIEADRDYHKNIYLLSSEADHRHASQVKPFIGYFSKYTNFNYIESQSSLVRTHTDVTFFNAPFILSVLNCLAFNMPPNFLNHVIVSDDQTRRPEVSKEPVFSLNKLVFDRDSKLHPEGVFFLRGLACQEYGDLDYILQLSSADQVIEIPLAKGNKPTISKEYYADTFVNYDKAYFCTKSYKGLDLQKLPVGLYQLSIKINLKTGDRDHHQIQYSLQTVIQSQNGRYTLLTKEGYLYLRVSEP